MMKKLENENKSADEIEKDNIITFPPCDTDGVVITGAIIPGVGIVELKPVEIKASEPVHGKITITED